MENPKGYASQVFRPADQYINPFDFGQPIRKHTGLWLKNLPPLAPSSPVAPPAAIAVQYRRATGAVKLRHHIDSSAKSWQERSKSFAGIATAMAQQWGTPPVWPASHASRPYSLPNPTTQPL